MRTLLKRLPAADGLPKTTYANVDGYWEREQTSRRYLIRREAFNKAFTSVRERELVLNWLIRKRLIALAVPKTASASSPILKVQHDWPDCGRVRSYEIRITRRPRKKGETTG